jgi:Xaa-Pro aminopeptidase
MTTCDLEKTRQFLSAGCDRARKLAAGGRIGLVGIANLPLGLVKDLGGLEGTQTVDLSIDYARLMVSRDESALAATRRALALAGEGIRLLAALAGSGKNLWEMAAEVDHRLRLAGCEDTNILLACSAGGRMRPAYPAPITPAAGDRVIAYIAVQCARHWGVAGTTLKTGPADEKLVRRLSLLKELQRETAAEIKAGLTLGEAKTIFLETARRKGMNLAQDMPLAEGVGFDLAEYPRDDAHRLEKNMVLQVVLAEDSENDGSALTVGMLQIRDGGSTWLMTDAV